MATVIEITEDQRREHALHRAWAETVVVGDMATLIPLYNRSERPPNRLPVPVRVDGIAHDAVSQTRVCFFVKMRWLDAGWFERGGSMTNIEFIDAKMQRIFACEGEVPAVGALVTHYLTPKDHGFMTEPPIKEWRVIRHEHVYSASAAPGMRETVYVTLQPHKDRK